MGTTASIRTRKPARADGTNQVRLQVILDRDVRDETGGCREN